MNYVKCTRAVSRAVIYCNECVRARKKNALVIHTFLNDTLWPFKKANSVGIVSTPTAYHTTTKLLPIYIIYAGIMFLSLFQCVWKTNDLVFLIKIGNYPLKKYAPYTRTVLSAGKQIIYKHICINIKLPFEWTR